MRLADLGWASEVLSAAATNAGTIDLDLRIHVSRTSGLVPALGDDSEDMLGPSAAAPTEKQGTFYATAKESHPSINAVVEELSTQGGHSTPPRHASLFTRLGRPDIPAIIREEIEASKGPISVNGKVFYCLVCLKAKPIPACGPARLTNAVRSVLKSGPAGPSAILHGGVPVSMHIENFSAMQAPRK
jgi:hypothetical protein